MADLVKIKFTRSYDVWNGGEVATFKRGRADWLVKKGNVAEYVDDPETPAEPVPVDDPESIPGSLKSGGDNPLEPVVSASPDDDLGAPPRRRRSRSK